VEKWRKSRQVDDHGSKTGMRLLLVEDNPRLQELLTESIHGAGWQIDVFGTVGDGQEAVATTPYDLLLIDLGLPDGRRAGPDPRHSPGRREDADPGTDGARRD
jgi:CheY-like chemotaxis protein